jgi:hypothetical protein
MIHSGTIRMPQFVSDIVQGDWEATWSGGLLGGVIRCKGVFLSGLRRSLMAIGAEANDACVVVFDREARRAEVEVGGPELLDQFNEGLPLSQEISNEISV